MHVTQKAKGVALLPTLRTMGVLPQWFETVTAYCLPYNMPETYSLDGMFARPCPERPRHGFVESRPIKGLKDLLDVYMEAKMADPKAEVLIMPTLSGNASGVLTDSSVTWAYKNDGATAGKGQQYIIPCTPGKLTSYLDRMSAYGAAGIKDSPYMEIVENSGAVTIVQLRDGPKVGRVRYNYVPTQRYIVSSVVIPTEEEVNDLLLWERRVNTMEEGTAIYCPGVSLSSHITVHGIAKGFAVITDPEAPKPVAGDALEPDSEQPPKLRRVHYRAMSKMFGKPMFCDRKSAIQASVSILHVMNEWGYEPYLLKLRVAGVSLMARILTAACIGEARHFYASGPGSINGSAPAIDWIMLDKSRVPLMKGSQTHGSRDMVFTRLLSINNMEILRSLIDQAVQDFEGPWRGAADAKDKNGDYVGSCSYGGPKWRDAARDTRNMIDAIFVFKDEPTEINWNKVVVYYNKAVNSVHNGGKLTSKFIADAYVDLSVTVPQFGLATPQVMEILCGPIQDAKIKVQKEAEKHINQGWNESADRRLKAEERRAQRIKDMHEAALQEEINSVSYYPCNYCQKPGASFTTTVYHPKDQMCMNHPDTDHAYVPNYTYSFLNSVHNKWFVVTAPPEKPRLYKCGLCTKKDGYSRWHPIANACDDTDKSIPTNCMTSSELSALYGVGKWATPYGISPLYTKKGEPPTKETYKELKKVLPVTINEVTPQSLVQYNNYLPECTCIDCMKVKLQKDMYANNLPAPTDNPEDPHYPKWEPLYNEDQDGGLE